MAASEPRQPVGGSDIRADSWAKVTGQARYAEDIVMPGLLYVRVLRSPHHHARLRALDVTLAAQVPGVVRVITANDVPGENGFYTYSRDEPVLTPVGDTVTMIGAPVAMVVAETREAAAAGLAAIQIDYDPLPAIFTSDEALQEGALQIREAGNVLSTGQVAHGDLEAAFAGSDVILEATYHTGFQEHSALERESLLGYIDEEGRVAVVGGCHEPHWNQGYVAAVLALDPARVRVIVPPTGGSFGGKQDPWPFAAVGLAAYLTGSPVQMAYSRRESFDASPKRHPYRLDYRVGATRDGHLTGLRVRIDANTGGYDAHGFYIPEYAVMASGGAYRWQAIDTYAQSVLSNGPKCGQFRGFGSPQPTFALECALDELCELLGEDPIAFRRKNHIEQAEPTFLGYPMAETLGYDAVLDAIAPHYAACRELVETFNAQHAGDPVRKGCGLAGMWYRFGKSGALKVETRAELAQDGHIVVYCSAPDYGQGTNTSMEQLAAETLGIARDRIELINADTARVPDSGIQGASRAVFWVGNSVCRAAETLKLAILSTAAEMLDTHPDDLVLSGDSRRQPQRAGSPGDASECGRRV